MSLTSDGERIAAWAEKNGAKEREETCFTHIEEQAETYWEDRTARQGIWEYDFDNPMDIKTQLEELWQEEEIMKEMITVSMVSMMKEKPEETETAREEEPAVSGNQNEIPDYVYMF